MSLSTGVFNTRPSTKHSVPLCTNNTLNRHEKGKRSDAREAPATQGGHAHGPFSGVFEISGPDISPVYIIGGYPVAEDGEKKPVETIKDERDLIIEDLRKRMETIETDYKMKIGEYQKANSELWARLHPAPKETETPVPDPVPANSWNVDKAVEAYHAALGIENKKE